jgi:hypothetical protein
VVAFVQLVRDPGQRRPFAAGLADDREQIAAIIEGGNRAGGCASLAGL